MSPYSVWTLIAWLFPLDWQFLQSFWGNSMKIPLQSKPFSFNQLPESLFGQNLFVDCESLCSYFSEQYTGLNCINSDNNDNLAPKKTLTCLYHSSIPRRVHAIHIQYCWHPRYWIFWTHNFEAHVISTFVVHWLWKFTMWLETCWKNVVWFFVKFFWAALKFCPVKSCAIFLDHPICLCYLQQSFSYLS